MSGFVGFALVEQKRNMHVGGIECATTYQPDKSPAASLVVPIVTCVAPLVLRLGIGCAASWAASSERPLGFGIFRHIWLPKYSLRKSIWQKLSKPSSDYVWIGFLRQNRQ